MAYNDLTVRLYDQNGHMVDTPATGLVFNAGGALTSVSTTTSSSVGTQVYIGRDPSAPDDPTKAALSYPAGGGTLTQWDVDSQTWI